MCGSALSAGRINQTATQLLRFPYESAIIKTYQSSYRNSAMSVTTIKLSSKGQIVIPKEIRDKLHWETGTQLTLVDNGNGISVRAISAKSGRNLGDLIGMLKHEGSPVAIDELCKPADISADWER